MKKILFIIFISTIHYLKAQTPSFVLNEENGTFNAPTNTIEADNGSIIVGSRFGDYSTSDAKLMLTKINASGKIVLNKLIDYDTLNFIFTKLTKVGNSIFGISNLKSFDEKRDYWEFIKFDQNFNILVQKRNYTKFGIFSMALEYDNIQKNLLALSSDNDWRIHFERYDFDGNKIGEKTDNKIVEIVSNITSIPNSENKIVSGFSYYYIISPKDSIVFIDDLPNFDLFGQGTVRWIRDSTFVYAGKHGKTGGIAFANFSINRPTQKIVKLQKLDTLDDLYREFPTFFTCLDFRTNDKIFFSGMTNVDFGLTINHESEEKSKIIIGKMNSNLDTTWVKYFGGDAYYATLNTLATSDGGCVVTATRYDNSKPNQTSMYIIKVNDKGEVTATTDIPDEYTQLSAYPNPDTDVIHIKIPNQALENGHTLDVELFDIQGKKVLSIPQILDNQELTVDINNTLPSGTYIFVVKKNRQILGTGKWIKQ